MKQLIKLTKRNVVLFFKDKGFFFVSLIIPVVLLLMYALFLGSVYRESFVAALGEFTFSETIIDGFVGSQLCSSILSATCVTGAFCSNMLMVQDKATGVYSDFAITPVQKQKVGLAYFISTELTTLIIALASAVVSLIFVAFKGWFLSFTDVLLLLLDVVLLTTMGTLLSSIVSSFLSTQGQISAVGTIVSTGYGYISGAYMPLSQFSEGIRNALGFFPGTYATSLFRNHSMRGLFAEMQNQGATPELITALKKAFDCDLYVFNGKVEIWMSYLVLIGAIVLLLRLVPLFHNQKVND